MEVAVHLIIPVGYGAHRIRLARNDATLLEPLSLCCSEGLCTHYSFHPLDRRILLWLRGIDAPDDPDFGPFIYYGCAPTGIGNTLRPSTDVVKFLFVTTELDTLIVDLAL